MTTSCPKCGHVPASAATIPGRKCPICGVEYAPENARTQIDQESSSAQARRAAVKDTGQRARPVDYPLAFYGLLFAFALFTTGFASKYVWIITCVVLGVTSFGFWVYSFRKQRAFADVPTSSIASAAQGYVEICGTVEKAPGCSLEGALTREPCVWYHYKIIERDQSGKRNHYTRESKAYGVPFVLRDESGECLVHPSGAEVTCKKGRGWNLGKLRYYEASIRPGDSVYVIGSFSTRATAPDERIEEKAAALLRSWLAEPQEFFDRFDSDEDRKISKSELARAHQAARADLARKSLNQGGLHMLRKPPDGRPFLIFSTDSHDRIVDSYTKQVKLHLSVLVISILVLGVNLAR